MVPEWSRSKNWNSLSTDSLLRLATSTTYLMYLIKQIIVLCLICRRHHGNQSKELKL
jgi:hypothetical protein